MENEYIPYHKPFPLNSIERDYINYDINYILQTGQLTNGIWCRKLEERIKKLYNVEYCLTTSSCTMGLLISLSYTKKKEFQIPIFNWWSDLYCLDFLDKIPVWTDINKDTWLSIGTNTMNKLILHTFGNIDKISPSLTGTNIFDASHCLGAKIDDVGLSTVFSLAPTKLVTACEGGLILTNDKKFYEYAIERRNRMGRMSEIHAVIGLQTLTHLEEIKEWKRKINIYYRRNIPGIFQEIEYESNYNTIGFLNTSKLKIPDNIETKQYYEPIIDKQFRNFCPNSFYVYDNIICLPSYFECPYEKITDLILEENKL